MSVSPKYKGITPFFPIAVFAILRIGDDSKEFITFLILKSLSRLKL